jgi:hypothetical protein
MPRGGTAALVLALAALVLPACGGDDDVSREEYAKQVDKICNDAERQLKSLDVRNARTPTEVAAVLDDVVAASRGAIDRLKAVERPSGEAGQAADRFVDTLRREFEKDALPALDDLKSAIRRGDRAAAADAAKRLNELENAKSDRFARQLGAHSCAA